MSPCPHLTHCAIESVQDTKKISILIYASPHDEGMTFKEIHFKAIG
jgi:hypothetical protein